MFFLQTAGAWFLFSRHNWWLEWCGLLWCFISCLDSHSDGTHSLQRIHWWASDAMLHFSKSVLMNSSTSWMTWEWVYFNLWMNYAFQSLNFVFYKICFCFWAFWDSSFMLVLFCVRQAMVTGCDHLILLNRCFVHNRRNKVIQIWDEGE